METAECDPVHYRPQETAWNPMAFQIISQEASPFIKSCVEGAARLTIPTDQKSHPPWESQGPGQEAVFTHLIIICPFFDKDIGAEYPTDTKGHCLPCP